MASLSLPQRYISPEDLDQFVNSDSITTVIPYAFRGMTGDYIQTLIYISDGNFVSVNFDPSDCTWKEEKKHSLSNSVHTNWEDLWTGDVFFLGKDAAVAQEAHDRACQTLDRIYSFIAPILPRSDSPPKRAAESSCTCQSQSQQEPQTKTEPSANLSHEYVFCADCNRFRGLRIGGEVLQTDAILDEDWLFEEKIKQMMQRIVETPSDNRYCLFSSGKSITRVEQAIDALSLMVEFEATSSATYNPIDHESLLCIEGGVVAGYLNWEEQYGHTVLDQMYVRPEFRRQGIAQTLVEEWREHYFTGKEYYLDEPNSKSKSLFEKVGDLNATTPPRAIEGHSLSPIHIGVNPPFWSKMRTEYSYVPQ